MTNNASEPSRSETNAMSPGETWSSGSGACSTGTRVVRRAAPRQQGDDKGDDETTTLVNERHRSTMGAFS